MVTPSASGLPSKEAALFRQVVKNYETKQFKKGIKSADQILKKFQDHGETLAMKGLLLSSLDHAKNKDEAYELVRKGVKLDIKSQVCWHVYGLLCRADRDYAQAIKCYRGALRHDPDNVKILRDLSMLQIQMRDVSGFAVTRQAILTLKPTNRINWFTFAIARHLEKSYTAAVGIVDAYEKTLEGTGPPENAYEHSEMLLYKNMLFEEADKHHKALAHLDEIEPHVVDKSGLQHKRAELMLRLGRFQESEKLYSELLKRNPENITTHAGLQAATLRTSTIIERWLEVEVDIATETGLCELYARLRRDFPRSNVVCRLPLDFVRDPDTFSSKLVEYAIPYLRKGVPSLFADLKPLCSRPDTFKTLRTIADGWLKSLEESSCLPGEDSIEVPSTLVWTRVLVSQLADLSGDSSRAFALIDEAIAHTPTCLDLHVVKARLYKHAGDLQAAADEIDVAREMDLADRYLNTKATRYLLRADRVEAAQKVVALFTRDGENESNLFDMQCMWYELEIGRAYQRLGAYGKALKSFSSVEKHFNDIYEDQFDFHAYCVRKMTLRAYVNMIRLEDGLYGHDHFVNAAYAVIETYLSIRENAHEKAASADTNGVDLDDMTPAERKKAESKRRKAEARAKAEAAAKPSAAAPSSAGSKGKKSARDRPVDDDPYGVTLAAKDPIQGASHYLRMLQLHAPSRLRTHTLSFDIALAKERPLLALRALCRAFAIDSTAPSSHVCAVRFLHFISNLEICPEIASVISTQLSKLGINHGTTTPSQLNDTLAARSDCTLEQLIACMKMRAMLGQSLDDLIAKVEMFDLSNTSINVCQDAAKILSSQSVQAEARFRARALQRYPLCPVFK